MADLFTRLVSGPAAAVPLAPRVPTVHEPIELSNVDEEFEVTPSLAPVPSVSRVVPPAPAAPVVPPSSPPLAVREVVVRGEVRGEAASVPAPVAGPAPVAVPASVPVGEPVAAPISGDLGGLWSPQQPESSKISPKLRPREPEPAVPPPLSPLPPRSSRSPGTPRSQPLERESQEPARTTVRIEIGRIEIRAPQRPQPLPVPQNQAPEGLTLADYLRGNDGRPR